MYLSRMKTYIVTGASRGIGMQTARHLANNKHRVIAVSRSEALLTQLVKECEPGHIIPVPADLTSETSVIKIKEAIDKDGCDGIVHNAGVLVNKPFADTTLEDWQYLVNVNLLSVVHLTRGLLDLLKPNAHLVMISSMGGFQGSTKFPGLAAYSTVKGALSILAECLSVELADRNIAVNCLCLGAVQTDMLEDAFPGFKAPVQSEEMGSYIADFTTSGHRFMNGKIIPVALNNPE